MNHCTYYPDASTLAPTPSMTTPLLPNRTAGNFVLFLMSKLHPVNNRDVIYIDESVNNHDQG